MTEKTTIKTISNEKDLNLVESNEEPSQLASLLEETLIDKHNERQKAETVISEKIIGFFFSAGWSPPCLDFLPMLVDIHEELVCKRKVPFEIIYISCDTSEEEMSTYMTKHGNWWAVPFGSAVIKEIRNLYNVHVVPKLVIAKPNGDLITMKGRKEVTDRGVIAFRSWFESSGLKLTSKSNIRIFESSVFEETNEEKSDQ